MLRPALLVAAALLSGCSAIVDPDAIAPEASTIQGAADTTAPTVTATSPSNLATGVSLAASVAVTFSEPVDHASAEGAFSITAPTGHSAGTFSWSVDDRTMTFAPTTPFSPGDSVSCLVTAAVKDLAGNAMAADAPFSFKVLQLGTVTLYSEPALDGVVWSFGQVVANATSLYVGDNATNDYGRAFVSFDLGQLPANAVAISSATLSVYQENGMYAGAPYDTLAPLLAERIDYGTLLGQTALTLPALDAVSYTLSTTSQSEFKFAGVTTSVDAAWTDRVALGGRVQFRLRFSVNTDGDASGDTASFSSGDTITLLNRPALSIGYLYP